MDTDTFIYRPTSNMQAPHPSLWIRSKKGAQVHLQHFSLGTSIPVWMDYPSNYPQLLIYYRSYIFKKPSVTLSRHITQDRLRGFTPCLASLKAYLSLMGLSASRSLFHFQSRSAVSPCAVLEISCCLCGTSLCLELCGSAPDGL